MIDERFPHWNVDVEKGVIYNLKKKKYIGNIDKYNHIKVAPQNNYKHRGLYQYIWMVANKCDIPDGYDVHHIDGNPLNNSIYNLELISHEEHIDIHRDEKREIMKKRFLGKKPWNKGKHISEEQKEKISKKVAQYTIDGELVKIWKSTMECGRNGFCQAHVAACCRGERKTHKGFIWKYI